jgi:hypothetical protein
MVGAAEQLSPDNPIELTYEISKVYYRLGITARATYHKQRKEMRLEARGLDRKVALRRGYPLPHPPLTHLTILYIFITRFHWVIEASF